MRSVMSQCALALAICAQLVWALPTFAQNQDYMRWHMVQVLDDMCGVYTYAERETVNAITSEVRFADPFYRRFLDGGLSEPELESYFADMEATARRSAAAQGCSESAVPMLNEARGVALARIVRDIRLVQIFEAMESDQFLKIWLAGSEQVAISSYLSHAQQMFGANFGAVDQAQKAAASEMVPGIFQYISVGEEPPLFADQIRFPTDEETAAGYRAQTIARNTLDVLEMDIVLREVGLLVRRSAMDAPVQTRLLIPTNNSSTFLPVLNPRVLVTVEGEDARSVDGVLSVANDGVVRVILWSVSENVRSQLRAFILVGPADTEQDDGRVLRADAETFEGQALDCGANAICFTYGADAFTALREGASTQTAELVVSTGGEPMEDGGHYPNDLSLEVFLQ